MSGSTSTKAHMSHAWKTWTYLSTYSQSKMNYFVKDQLQTFPQTRDDYKELLVLILLVLGEKAPEYKIGVDKTYVVHTCVVHCIERDGWQS